jgi:hypothetical protein
MNAGAFVPVPAAVIVHETFALGRLSCHDPFVYGDGQEITGAAGVANAVRKLVHADHGPVSPRSSVPCTRT